MSFFGNMETIYASNSFRMDNQFENVFSFSNCIYLYTQNEICEKKAESRKAYSKYTNVLLVITLIRWKYSKIIAEFYEWVQRYHKSISQNIVNRTAVVGNCKIFL